ncbi:MAG: recombinase family protein, partial [Chloroflexota bacterium]
DHASGSYKDELDNIARQMSDINRRLNNLYQAIEGGNINFSDLAPRIHELKGQQERLLARKAELEGLLSDRRVELASPQLVQSYVQDLHGVLNSSTLAERRAFIKSFVKELKVKKEEARLTYTLPLPPEGISEERVGVLPIVRYGGRYRI